MEREEEDWIENTLKESERRKCVRKIISLKKMAAVAKGDNYTSDLSRLRIKAMQKDGQLVDKWAIYKRLPTTEHYHNFMRKLGFFNKEIRMYNEVLPLLENIRREQEEGEPLWGECYGVKGCEALLLEDLSVKGYKMGQRTKGLDFAHCSLAMRALGKFHALTVISKERGQLIVSDYDKHFFQKNHAMLEKFYFYVFEDLAQNIELRWEEEWKQYAVALRKVSASLTENLLKDFTRDEEEFNVLNHGDCWVNNILFKYDQDGRPISLRFVDFQVSYYNNPGFDLQYFLQVSPQTDVRPRNEELVQVYHSSLLSSLQLYGYDGKAPTLEDIHDGFKKAALFGMASAVSLLPIIKLESEDVPDMEELMKKSGQNFENFELNQFPKKGEEYRKTMQTFLVAIKENGTLQL